MSKINDSGAIVSQAPIMQEATELLEKLRFQDFAEGETKDDFARRESANIDRIVTSLYRSIIDERNVSSLHLKLNLLHNIAINFDLTIQSQPIVRAVTQAISRPQCFLRSTSLLLHSLVNYGLSDEHLGDAKEAIIASVFAKIDQEFATLDYNPAAKIKAAIFTLNNAKNLTLFDERHSSKLQKIFNQISDYIVAGQMRGVAINSKLSRMLPHLTSYYAVACAVDMNPQFMEYVTTVKDDHHATISDPHLAALKQVRVYLNIKPAELDEEWHLAKSKHNFFGYKVSSEERHALGMYSDIAIFDPKGDVCAIIEVDGPHHMSNIDGVICENGRTRARNQVITKRGIPLIKITEQDFDRLTRTEDAIALLDQTPLHAVRDRIYHDVVGAVDEPKTALYQKSVAVIDRGVEPAQITSSPSSADSVVEEAKEEKDSSPNSSDSVDSKEDSKSTKSKKAKGKKAAAAADVSAVKKDEKMNDFNKRLMHIIENDFCNLEDVENLLEAESQEKIDVRILRSVCAKTPLNVELMLLLAKSPLPRITHIAQDLHPRDERDIPVIAAICAPDIFMGMSVPMRSLPAVTLLSDLHQRDARSQIDLHQYVRDFAQCKLRGEAEGSIMMNEFLRAVVHQDRWRAEFLDHFVGGFAFAADSEFDNFVAVVAGSCSDPKILNIVYNNIAQAKYHNQFIRTVAKNAVIADNLEVIKFLLKKDPQLFKASMPASMIIDGQGGYSAKTWSMLSMACKGNGSESNVAVVRYLISAGADVNGDDVIDSPPIFCAVQFENMGALRELLDREEIVIDRQLVHITSDRGRARALSVMSMDVSSADMGKTIKKLKKEAEQDLRSVADNALIAAIHIKRADIVDLLLERGANCNIAILQVEQVEQGFRYVVALPLTFALEFGDVAILESLHRKGSSFVCQNPALKDYSVKDPLCAAFRSGKAGMVRWLFDHNPEAGQRIVGANLGKAVECTWGAINAKELIDSINIVNERNPDWFFREGVYKTTIKVPEQRFENKASYDAMRTFIAQGLREYAAKTMAGIKPPELVAPKPIAAGLATSDDKGKGEIGSQ